MINYFKRVSIKTSVFIVFFLVITILSTILSSIFYVSLKRIYVDKTNESVISSLNEKNEQITSLITKNLGLSYSLSNDTLFKNKIKAFKSSGIAEQLDIENYVKTCFEPYFMNNIEISNISLILPGKLYPYNKGSAIYPLELAMSQEWFTQLSGTSNMLISNYKGSESDYISNDSISTFSAIFGENQEIISYLCMNISKKYINDNFLNSDDSSKIIMVDNNQNSIIGNSFSELNITKSDEIVQKSADGVLYEDINSYNTLIAYSKTNNQGWKLLEIAKTSDVYHYLYSITIYFIVIFLIFYLIALLLARFLSNLITSPITALSMHMFNLKGTNLSDKLEVSYENEIGKLIDSYNNMITKIDELMKESAKQEQLKHQAEIEILQTKVMSLQSQINPHFLYNTLYSISWKALDEGAPSVSELLNDLSRLYKSNLYTNTDICTIDKELNQVILYINLQKKCFSKKFDFSTEIQQDLLQLYIPRFILQPFVENAFVHAFKKPGTDYSLKIKFFINDFLHIEICDNGSGIDEQTLKNYNNELFDAEHTGVSNVAQRIRLICGEDYKIRYTQNATSGTTVHIKLPIIYKRKEV